MQGNIYSSGLRLQKYIAAPISGIKLSMNALPVRERAIPLLNIVFNISFMDSVLDKRITYLYSEYICLCKMPLT